MTDLHRFLRDLEYELQQQIIDNQRLQVEIISRSSKRRKDGKKVERQLGHLDWFQFFCLINYNYVLLLSFSMTLFSMALKY